MAERNKKSRKLPGMKSVIGGSILTDSRVTKHTNFVLMLVMFGFALIMNRNWSERTIRQIGILEKEIEGLRAEYSTVSAKLMDASRPSEVVKKVEEAGIGLIEPVSPPQKLTIKKED